MDGGVVRSLVLACSLLLALPPGWCCRFACQRATATTTTAATGTKTADGPDDGGGCCPHCPHQSKPSPGPADGPTPGGKPPVPTDTTCSCAGWRATLPVTPSVEQADTGIVLYLLPPTNAAPGVGHRAAVTVADAPPPAPPLHVLNCVWLC